MKSENEFARSEVKTDYEYAGRSGMSDDVHGARCGERLPQEVLL
jgi:hypothetical protein